MQSVQVPPSTLDELHLPHCWEHQAPSRGVLPTQSYCCATEGQSHEGARGMAVQFPSEPLSFTTESSFVGLYVMIVMGLVHPPIPAQSHFLPTASPSLAPSWSLTRPRASEWSFLAVHTQPAHWKLCQQVPKSPFKCDTKFSFQLLACVLLIS